MKQTPKYRCVYILECKGLFKIGKTDNLSGRVKALEIGNPFPVQVAHVIYTDDYHKVEKALHQIFDTSHERGEWFNLSARELAAVKSMSVEQILNVAENMKPDLAPPEPTVPPGQMETL